MKYRRGLGAVVLVFGIGWVTSAAVTAHRAHLALNLPESIANSLRPKEAEAVQQAVNHLSLHASLDLLLAALAFISAYGILRERKWAPPLWLTVVTTVAIGSVIAIALKPAQWFNYIGAPALCFVSWLVICGGGRKRAVQGPHDILPDGPMTPEEIALVASLEPATIARIDAALMSHALPYDRKVAMIVAKAMGDVAAIAPNVPDLFFAERIKALVASGQLVARGDLNYMRFSEVKLRDS